MTCKNCNNKVPFDSEFCQYCGSKVEVETENITSYELVESPTEDNLYSAIDGVKQSEKAPMEVIPRSATLRESHTFPKDNLVKTKYCSRCGSAIDNITKVCSGCGKKYFKGLQFNKVSVTIMALSLVIAVVSSLCIIQYSNVQKLKNNVADLESQISLKQSIIGSLENEINNKKNQINELELSNLKKKWELEFYEDYAVCVNEGSNRYHKYGCDDFDTSYFWIFNTEAAEQKGYYACPKCNK